VTVGARLVEARFPDVSQVAPKRSAAKVTVTVGAAELTAALRFVGKVWVSDDRTHGVRIGVRDGEVELFAQSASGNECRQVVAAETEGGPLTVSAALPYLVDAVTACGDRVVLGVVDSTSPIRVDPALETTTAFAVVMPMRL
jgi:DNA polymerase III sliding clamp (beta) subunit (PCNA family)